ncbi:MAG: glycosyltransferase [Prevotellaceae bacterium]|jgi:glycosyltransferase involved in cell wall biosynthesis|nr:glycosyltransferase [Prevotellaceae bacterium]
MVKISVIIPVYNAAKYIIACVDSLLNQTLSDLEVILVDDHGQDNSIEIVKTHIEKHERKNMFHFTETTVNSGPGTARNVGMQVAEGKYVAFLDSDDWVEPAMYADLYESAVLHEADICYCHAIQENLWRHKFRILKNPMVSPGDFPHQNKSGFLVNHVANFWTFIYRRDFLKENTITFPPEKSAEDSYFIACNILCAKRIAMVNKPLYHYILRADSLSKIKNSERYIDKLSAFNRLLQVAKNNGLYTEYQMELDFIYIKKSYLMAALNYLTNAVNPQVIILKNIYKSLVANVPNYRTNLYYKTNYKVKILVILLHKMPRFSKFILSNAARLSCFNAF